MRPAAVAQVCLYGTRETGFAYLASRPELSAPIVAKGGWNADETRPTGRYRSLTEVIAGAKLDLVELGITRGEVIVFFPGGERCARTRVDAFEAVSDMAIEPAPLFVVSADAIASAARPTGSSSARQPARRSRRSRGTARPRVVPLGATSSGKPIPPVPAELGALEKASSEAGPLFSDEALPAIRAANSAARAHFDSYARDFTLADHREAARLLRDQHEGDRYLRFARGGLAMLHERFAEMLRAQQRREFGA